MTTTLDSSLLSPPKPDTLTSPGAALGARAALEDEQWRAIEPIIDRLLAEVYRQAVDALSAEQLLAAGRVKDPFAYTNIMGAWTETIRELSRTRGVTEYLTDSLRDSDIPIQMYERTRRLLKQSRDEGWTDYKTKVALRKVLVPPRPGKGMTEEQGTYRARIRMLARTASTRTFNERQLRALRHSDVDYAKWVTRHDAKVRDTHRQVDGTVKRIGVDFIVGGHPMAYPGDPKGPPSETVNCRCVLIGDSGSAGVMSIVTGQNLPLPFPMSYGFDVAQSALIQTGELTEALVARIGQIPEHLALEEMFGVRVLINPETNGPLQYFLRHAPGYVPHLPTPWVGERGYMLTYAERFPAEEGIKTLQDLFTPDWFIRDPDAPSVEAVVHAIDSMLDRSHTTQPSIAYRGFVAWKDMRPGDELLDRGYTSVSPDLDVAQRFVAMRTGAAPEVSLLRPGETYDGQPLIAFIRIPVDTPIGLGDATVKEFILPRDSKFRVVDINPPYVLMERVP